MGGKKGHRTKGNTRPSSSGHSAELLSASGVTGFVGFSGLATDVAGFATSSATDDVETTVDSDFRMVMKKTTKRDSITKIKALQEFAELCQIKDEIAVKGALPYWPRLFVKLAVDNDRRVREATHQANKQIVTKVKKDLAPYLKSIMGIWVVSMCDPFAPAASVAYSAFQMAFPLSKQPEAFEFCKDEIFHFISETLFTQTAKTLSDVETSSTEEMESKYVRLLASSLNGLKLFITTVNDMNNEKTIQLLTKVLDDNKFWKYANHKEAEIRIAWYIFVASLCQCAPGIITKYAMKLAPLTLGRLDEQQPVVATLIWDATLHLLVIVDNVWQYVNVKKAVFPQLWRTLQEGGKGNARKIFKNLLPLLSKIPESVYGEKIKFSTDFFANLKRGILNEKVQSSSSELRAVIQAFFECLRYILFQNLGSSEEECKIRQNLIQDQLFPIVELAILDTSCKMQKVLFSELGSFLRIIESQINSEMISSRKDALSDILHHFWTDLFGLNDKILSADDENATQITLNHFAQFFHFLYTKDKVLASPKVMFSKDVKPETATNENYADLIPNAQQQLSSNVLIKNTHKLCSSILLKIMSNPKVGYLNLLSEMVNTVPSKSLFAELIQTFNGDSNMIDLDDTDPLTEFLDKVLLQWLSNRSKIFGDNEQVVPSILRMILIACTCLPQEQAFAILNQLCTNKDYYVLEKLIFQIISKESEIPNLYKWLKSEQVGNCMMSLATEIVNEGGENVTATSNSEIWNLLKICFTASKDFEPVIGLEFLNKILTVLTTVLLKHSGLGSTSNMVKFVCELAQSLFLSCLGCYQLSAVEDLLVCLFQLSFEKNRFSEESQKHIQETWCLGTKQLVTFQGVFIKTDGFLSNAAQILQDQLLKRTYNLNQVADLSVVEDNALCLLQSVYSSLPPNDNRLFEKSCSVRALIECILPSKETISELESKLSDCCPGRKLYDLNVPVVQVYADTKLVTPPLISLNKCLLKIMCKLLLNIANEEEGDNVKEHPVISDSAKEFVIPIIISSLLVITYESILYIHPEVTYKVEVDHMFTEIKDNVKYLLQYLSAKDFKIIFEKLFKLAQTKRNLFFSVFIAALPYVPDTQLEILVWLRENLKMFLNEESKVSQKYKLAQWMIPCSNDSLAQEIFANVSNSLISEEHSFDLANCIQHLETIACCLNVVVLNESNEKSLKAVLQYLQKLKSQADLDFLCESLISEKDCSKVEFVRILSQIFIVVLNRSPHILELWLWDFIMCTACGWINTLHQSKNLITASGNIHMASSVSSLLSLLKSFVMSDCIENIATHLRSEWKELYFTSIYSLILPLLFELCDKTSKMGKNSWDLEQLFYALSNSLYNLPSDDMMICISETPQTPASPVKVLSLVEELSSLLISKSHPVQWAAHYLLIILMPKLAELAAEQAAIESDSDEDQRERPPPQSLAKTLTTTGQIVDTMLVEFCVEDCCLVQPYTDSYTYTLAYLLSWRQLLKVFSCSSSEVRSEYALYLQSSKLLESLLLNLFRLMPNNPVLTTTYTEIRNPSTCNSSCSIQLQNIAYQVYLNTLSQLPALVRQWWNNQDKRTAEYVSKFTTTNASSLISHEEIKSVQDTQVQFNNMTVKARPTAREVVATYTMEEITIELVIKLPPNHPLGPVTVETGKRIGVGLTQWRHWMLQLTTFLTYQNGSILDGLSLWKRNVDKRFEGVEECMICFYVLHGATCQLPRLTCRTCKKKFHSACLYKWFSTSQNASCPLCRNLF